MEILRGWQNSHTDYLAYGVRILVIEKATQSLWYFCHPGQDIESKTVPQDEWKWLLLSLNTCKIQGSCFQSWPHLIPPEKQDRYWKMSVDFWKLNQVVTLIAVAMINILSLLEQNNMASGTGKRPFIKKYVL